MTDSKPHVTFIRGPIVASRGSINNEATPAIAFAYLSAYLKARGYRSEIVDAIGEGLNRYWDLEKYPGFACQGLSFEEIADRVPRDTDVLAFSGMFSGEWPVLRDLIRFVTERVPGKLVVIGGEHVTALPEFTLRDCPVVDVVVRGEGEHTLYELLETRWAGDYTPVGGISFIDGDGRYVGNGELPRIRDLSTIPWPDWPEGYLERFWKTCKSYGVGSERDMPFLASRGCPYRCTFCSNPSMWTTRYILRDPDDCVAEIKHYIKRYDITALQFYDLTAIMKKTWVLAFCEKLNKAGIRLKWSLPSGTRSEVLDSETITAIQRAGCKYLVYAPESGSQKTLDLVKKQIKLPRLTASVLEAVRQGIGVRTNFIIGFPGETRRQIFQTLFFGLTLAVRGVDEVPIFLFSPYPGSKMFWKFYDEGKVNLGDEYFMRLTSLNGKYLSLQSISFNEHVGPLELVVWRSLFMVMNYLVGYLLYPKRILRTLRSLYGGVKSSTVLEHRIQDAIHRKWKEVVR